jgi:hypothetical protein
MTNTSKNANIMHISLGYVAKNANIPGICHSQVAHTDVFFMYCQCIRDVSWMYMYMAVTALSLYLSCITDVLEVVPYTPVFLHTLAITFLRPSPSGHPVFGISSPWVWLLGGWRCAFFQAGHSHSSMPCWVLCSRNRSWAGIQVVPLLSMLQT